MPNLRSQIVGPLPNPLPSGTVPPWANGAVQGVYLWASNGKEVWVRAAQVLAQYQAAAGTPAQKKAAAVAWVKSQIETILGVDQVAAANITHDIDPATGRPSKFEVVG